jgi:hypothetical protein
LVFIFTYIAFSRLSHMTNCSERRDTNTTRRDRSKIIRTRFFLQAVLHWKLVCVACGALPVAGTYLSPFSPDTSLLDVLSPYCTVHSCICLALTGNYAAGQV